MSLLCANAVASSVEFHTKALTGGKYLLPHLHPFVLISLTSCKADLFSAELAESTVTVSQENIVRKKDKDKSDKVIFKI